MGIQLIKRMLPVSVLVMILVSACSLGAFGPKPPAPTALPATNTPRPRPTRNVPTVTPTVGPQVDITGANFYYDPSLGIAVGGPVPADSGDVGSIDWMLPPRFEFTISKYPLTHSEMTPRIVVFPIGPLESFNTYGATTMKALADLIEARPEPDKIVDPIPQMTYLQDPELFHSKVKFLDFKNGSGIRFVAEYASDIRPVSNEDLVYHFVGITADGTYAVAVFLPLTQKDLVASEDALTDEQANTIVDDFTKYLTDSANELNIADDSSFKPSLSLLDKLAESFEVKVTTAPVVTAGPDDATPTDAPRDTPTPEFHITPAP